MKKYVILLILRCLLSFGESLPVDAYDGLFDDVFQENIVNKRIKITQGIKISNLNPVMINDNYSKRVIDLIYDTLFEKDKNGQIIPELVKNYSWIDEKTLYLELRNNVYFHNGDELRSEDVRLSLEQLKNSNLKYLFSEIMTIKILDDKKLVIKLSEEDNTFLEKLTYEVTSIIKIENKKIYGTGKYYVDRITKDGLLLKKNNSYFDKNFGVEELEFISDIQDQKRIIDLFNEETDIVLDIDQATLDHYKDIGIIDKSSAIFKEKLINSLILTFGNKNRYSREEKRLIKSILEKDDILFFPQELSKLEIKKDEYIIKNLLKYKELKREFDLMILNTDKNLEEAQNLKRAFKKVGIKLNILPHNLESYNQKFKNKDYDIALYNISVVGDNILFNIAKIFLNDLENYEIYNSLNPFFRLLKQEKVTSKREIILVKIINLISKEIPYIPIKHYKNYVVISEKVQNYYKNWEQ